MNSTELKNFVRDTAAQKFINDNPEARAINDKSYTFVIPVSDENGETVGWARCGFTSCQMNDTKSRPGFNPDEDSIPAQPAFDNMLAKRAADAAAKKAERAKKESKKHEEEDEEF